MALCAWRESSDHRCLEVVAAEGQFCILHDPNQSKDPAAFRTRVAEKMQAGDFDFRGTFFPADITFEGDLKRPNFSEASFGGIASFRGATFHAEALFRNTSFQRKASFCDATFQDFVNFSGATFQSEAEFCHTVFRDGARFYEATIHGTADFLSSAFEGMVLFQEITFQGRASFRAAKFRDLANFWGVVFQGPADFEMAELGLSPPEEERDVEARFWLCVFKKEATFELTSFWQGADFKGTKFLAEAGFRGTTFAAASKSSGNIWPVTYPVGQFTSTRFAGKTYFDQNGLGGSLYFDGTEFASALFFRGPFRRADRKPVAPASSQTSRELDRIAPEVTFLEVFFEHPEQVRFEWVDLAKVRFSGTDVRKVSFGNVDWPKTVWFDRLLNKSSGSAVKQQLPPWSKILTKVISLFRERLGIGRWRQVVAFCGHKIPADFPTSGADLDPDMQELARRVCRDLKANLEDQRDYADAGDFYYGEMELRRRQLARFRGSLLWLYWLVCGYGEKPLRALTVFSCMWLLLAGLLMPTWFTVERKVGWRIAEFDGKSAFQPYFKEALGHSLRSLTLQQRGSYLEPSSPWATRLTLAANLIGPIQLGVFFLAMRRRLRR